jgi:hypothetical protein
MSDKRQFVGLLALLGLLMLGVSIPATADDVVSASVTRCRQDFAARHWMAATKTCLVAVDAIGPLTFRGTMDDADYFATLQTIQAERLYQSFLHIGKKPKAHDYARVAYNQASNVLFALRQYPSHIRNVDEAKQLYTADIDVMRVVRRTFPDIDPKQSRLPPATWRGP